MPAAQSKERAREFGHEDWHCLCHSIQRTQRSWRMNIVAVSGNPDRVELVDALLVGASCYDVVFVESIARGYSRIKELGPDLVVLLLDFDDIPGWQLLSMLKTDAELADIPVMTCSTRRVDTGLEDGYSALIRNARHV
jgi:CheY-like chemotaxis protein